MEILDGLKVISEHSGIIWALIVMVVLSFTFGFYISRLFGKVGAHDEDIIDLKKWTDFHAADAKQRDTAIHDIQLLATAQKVMLETLVRRMDILVPIGKK